MSDLAVNSDLMNGMTKSMSDAVGNLENSLKLMHESVSELNKTWEGPNHTSFVETFESRYEVMEQLNQSMKKYLASVKKAKKAYIACEGDVSEIVGRL